MDYGWDLIVVTLAKTGLITACTLVLAAWSLRWAGAQPSTHGHGSSAVHIKSTMLQAWLLVGAVLLAAASVWWATRSVAEFTRASRAVLFSQLGLVAAWGSVAAIQRHWQRGMQRRRRRKAPWFLSPRGVVRIGLAAHIAVFGAAWLAQCTPWAERLRSAGALGGAILFGCSVLLSASYVVAQLRRQRSVALSLSFFGGSHGRLGASNEVHPGAAPNHLAVLFAVMAAALVAGGLPFTDTVCFGVDETGAPRYTELYQFAYRDFYCSESAVAAQLFDWNAGVLLGLAGLALGASGAAQALGSQQASHSWNMVRPVALIALALLGPALLYQTLDLSDIVRWQGDHAWGAFTQPLAFALALAAIIRGRGESGGEPPLVSELVLVAYSGLLVVVFLGGWGLPFMHRDGLWLEFGGTVIVKQIMPHGTLLVLGMLTFLAKIMLLCRAVHWLRRLERSHRVARWLHASTKRPVLLALANAVFTALVMWWVKGTGPATNAALDLAGDITMVVIALGSVFAAAWSFSGTEQADPSRPGYARCPPAPSTPSA